MTAILAYLTAIENLAPSIISLGMDIVPLLGRLRTALSTNTDPTDDDWAALAAVEKPLRDDLQAPITDAARASIAP